MTMEQRLAKAVAPSRFVMLLLGSFSVLALVLAAVGIYGVMAYLVTQRTQEIGVRMALGAQKRDVLQLVVSKGMALAIIGTAIGLIASVALTRLMRSLLFGVSAWDMSTLTAVALVLALSALMASFVPARRAANIDPVEALEVLEPLESVVIGDIASCRKKIAGYRAIGVDRLMCLMSFGRIAQEDVLASLRLTGEELIPEFSS